MPVNDITRALELLDSGKSTEAISLSSQLVLKMPMHVSAYVVLARALESQEQFHTAFEAWCQAQSIMPTSPLIRSGVVRTARKMMGPYDMRFAEFTTDEANRLSVNQYAYTPDPKAVIDKEEDALLRDPLVTDVDGPKPEPAGPGVVREAVPETRGLETAAHAQPAVEPESAEGYADSFRPTSAGDSIGELDKLIEDLETARIEPRPDLDALEPPDLESDVDDMVSETLARIFETQKQYGEAARVYEKLALREPDRADEFLVRAEDMRAKLRA